MQDLAGLHATKYHKLAEHERRARAGALGGTTGSMAEKDSCEGDGEARLEGKGADRAVGLEPSQDDPVKGLPAGQPCTTTDCSLTVWCGIPAVQRSKGDVQSLNSQTFPLLQSSAPATKKLFSDWV